MKKILLFLILFVISLSIIYFTYNFQIKSIPNEFYGVYLNGEYLGNVASNTELEAYINQKNEQYKNIYGVDQIYAPQELNFVKTYTYNQEVMSNETIYQIIEEEDYFTVLGYSFKIKKSDDTLVIYVLDKEIFDDAVTQAIKIFVGEDNYESYINDTQTKIDTTGAIIEDIYLDNDITVKDDYIPVNENIYTDADELAKFLVFGTTEEQDTYVVQDGDTIENIAFNHEISTEEFLISNPTFTSSSNLLYSGQEVTIGVTNPQIQIVIEEYVVEDITSSYTTEEKYDEEKVIGDNEIIQVGEDGLDRVTQKIKTINGIINSVDRISIETLEPAISEIVVKGQKTVSNVGSLTIWAWPTNSGYTITSNYEWRINPITGLREFHDGIDIAGTGYGSNIYAANNGTVVTATYSNIGGNYIIIDHNNGYYTYYGHMSKLLVEVGDTVARGSVIGLMGWTGQATGTHLHFGLYWGRPYAGGTVLNPWSIF
ncbi:MAG: M23 family metallopeptidase [Bacilli bacterium]|nr:M23 family metallopeptidase [Bacilli bacterium]